MEPVRRIVTGHDDRGRAVVVSDAPVPPLTLSLMPGFETIELWHTDDTPAMPDRLGEPGAPRYFPPTGGTVFRVVTFPPDATGVPAADLDLTAAFDEAVAKVPDLVERLEPDAPGMHTTDTVDYAVVMDGEIDLELDVAVLASVPGRWWSSAGPDTGGGTGPTGRCGWPSCSSAPRPPSERTGAGGPGRHRCPRPWRPRRTWRTGGGTPRPSR